MHLLLTLPFRCLVHAAPLNIEDDRNANDRRQLEKYGKCFQRHAHKHSFQQGGCCRDTFRLWPGEESEREVGLERHSFDAMSPSPIWCLLGHSGRGLEDGERGRSRNQEARIGAVAAIKRELKFGPEMEETVRSHQYQTEHEPGRVIWWQSLFH